MLKKIAPELCQAISQNSRLPCSGKKLRIWHHPSLVSIGVSCRTGYSPRLLLFPLREFFVLATRHTFLVPLWIPHPRAEAVLTL